MGRQLLIQLWYVVVVLCLEEVASNRAAQVVLGDKLLGTPFAPSFCCHANDGLIALQLARLLEHWARGGGGEGDRG